MKANKRIEIPMDPAYQADQWGLWHSLRDLVANAQDAEVELAPQGIGKKDIGYDPTTCHVWVANHGVKLPPEALIIGKSSKRDRTDMIGRFGEGLNLSLLSLARIAADKSSGITFQVTNYDERWSVEIAPSKVFNADVLVITRTPLRVPHKFFSIHLHGVKPEVWAELSSKMLCLSPPREEEQLFFDANRKNKGRLLISKAHVKNVYALGMAVFDREDMLFGYDLPLALNRDRSVVDEWDLRWAIAHVFDTIALGLEHDVYESEVDQRIAKTSLTTLIEAINADLPMVEVNAVASFASYLPNLCRYAADLFETNDKDAHPVARGDEAVARAMGFKPVSMPSNGARFYGAAMKSPIDRMAERLGGKITADTMIRTCDLYGEQRANWQFARDRLLRVFTQEFVDAFSDQYLAFTTESVRVLRVAKHSKVLNDGDFLIVGLSCLDNRRSAMATLISCAALMLSATPDSTWESDVLYSIAIDEPMYADQDNEVKHRWLHSAVALIDHKQGRDIIHA